MTNTTEVTWGIPPEQRKEAAVKMTDVPPLRGDYKAVLFEAIRGFEKSGAEFVKISAEINGLKYSFQKDYLFSGNSKNNAVPLFAFNIFMGLFGILKLIDNDAKTKPMNARVYDKETNSFVDLIVDQYYEILNKPVGIIASTEPIYQNLIIDGYTKQPVTDKTEAHHIYFPNYDVVVAQGHRILRYFDIKTRMTYFEIEKKNQGIKLTPNEVDSTVEKLFNQKERIYNAIDLDNRAEKTLKKQLDIANISYVKERFISFTEYGGKIPMNYVSEVISHQDQEVPTDNTIISPNNDDTPF